MTRFLKLHADEGNVYRVVHLVEDSLLLTMQKWLRLRVISLYSGLGMKASGLVTVSFKSCVSQLPVDLISRNFEYF